MDAEVEYIISQILQIRENKYGEKEYYLIWEGYEDDGPCWENEGDLYDLGIAAIIVLISLRIWNFL
jgi:hypothetical protein